MFSCKNHSPFPRQFIFVKPSGIFQSIEEVSAKIPDMILFQIGEAPVIPEAILLIGELSLFPTQVRY